MSTSGQNLRQFLLIVGVFLFFILIMLTSSGQLSVVGAMGGVALLMAMWWIFEVLPLGVTALIPIVAYPVLGIMPTKKIAPIYMSSTLLLFVGGFFVAIAMARWNLHKRIALFIISLFGSSPKRLLFGFISASGFLSMWISNTATTVMMVSIGLALVQSYEKLEKDETKSKALSSTLMMAIAYGATIGGMATLVGTPPNLAFTRIYALSFPSAAEITFGTWFSLGLPICLINILFAWFALYYFNLKGKGVAELDELIIKSERESLGKMKYEEKWILLIFILMALLWIFRKDLNLGFMVVPGWSSFLTNANYFDDATVAISCALILFMIPVRSKHKENYQRVLDQSAIAEIPWQTILLFGGGFALAKGIQSSGLSEFIGSKFSLLADVSLPVVIASLSLGMSLLTELTSNMASTEMLLPILASVASATGINPLQLMVPATLAASCAFMLPAATAPNAIIFGSKRVKIKDMVRVGIIINLFSVSVITLACLFIMPLLFT